MAVLVYDCIIIGAGASGLTAAIFVARSGAHTAVLERGPRPCRKLLLTGGGRGNVLPPRASEIDYLSDSPRAVIRELLATWPLPAIRAFFEQELGVPLTLEPETGKLFPRSQKAEEVASALERVAQTVGARIRLETRATRVRPILKGEGQGLLEVEMEDGQPLRARAVVLATGGSSWPDTGSDGWGYGVARELGHALVDPYPALVALGSHRPDHRELAGTSLPSAVRVYGPEKKLLAESRGTFAFTPFGYAGTAILNVAHFVWRGKVRLEVAWRSLARDRWQAILKTARTSIARALSGLLPTRLAQALVREARLDPSRNIADIRRDERERLLRTLAEYPLPATRGPGFESAEVTGGGVALPEVQATTLESRHVPGLYFTGELLDVFGRVGGYNLLWSWITGRLAGLAAASRIAALQRSEAETEASRSSSNSPE